MHRADGDAECLRGLGVTQSFDRREMEGVALLRVKSQKGPGNSSQQLDVIQVC
jgi:hypothetical protein